MAEQLCSSNNLLLVMDSLWFQHIILFSHHNFSCIDLKARTATTTTITTTSSTVITSAPSRSQSLPSSPSSSAHHSLEDNQEEEEEEEEEEDTSSSSVISPVLALQGDCNDEGDADDEMKMKYKRRRPRRLSLVIASSNKMRAQSSSPSIHKLPKHLRRSKQLILQEGGLRKTRSCKRLMDLEYEEVKGFMDLGFTFDKEQLSPRMMSVIPGLQRVLKHDPRCKKVDRSSSVIEDDDDRHDHEKKRSDSYNVISRPYLSEAWLIKRPDSPLLNLRIPRFSSSSSSPADMKKHLRFWARTVASAIQLEY